MIFNAFGTPQKVGIQPMRRVAGALVKLAFLLKIRHQAAGRQLAYQMSFKP